jgi:hypothetical protein
MERDLQRWQSYLRDFDDGYSSDIHRRVHLLEFVLSGRYHRLYNLVLIVRHLNAKHSPPLVTIDLKPDVPLSALDMVTREQFIEHRRAHHTKPQDHRPPDLRTSP